MHLMQEVERQARSSTYGRTPPPCSTIRNDQGTNFMGSLGQDKVLLDINEIQEGLNGMASNGSLTLPMHLILVACGCARTGQ